MGTHIEWTQGIIRSGEAFGEYGDPYTFAASVTVKNGVAEVRGAVGVMARSTAREVAALLKERGVLELRWERIKRGRVKIVVVNLVDGSVRYEEPERTTP
ncbi:MAG: hypothetical protein AB7W37_06545 [Syntrophobacteraceae bacterium]